MTPQRLAAWGVLAFTLIVLAEFPTTSELAVAFGYLILVSVLLTAGPAAFANLSRMTGGSSDTTGGGHSVGGKVAI